MADEPDDAPPMTVRGIIEDLIEEGSDKWMWKNAAATETAARRWHRELRRALAIMMLDNNEFRDDAHRVALQEMVNHPATEE